MCEVENNSFDCQFLDDAVTISGLGASVGRKGAEFARPRSSTTMTMTNGRFAAATRDFDTNNAKANRIRTPFVSVGVCQPSSNHWQLWTRLGHHTWPKTSNRQPER